MDELDNNESPQPRGYMLGKQQTMADVLSVTHELLKSEGLDPEWPGFEKDAPRNPEQHGDRK